MPNSTQPRIDHANARLSGLLDSAMDAIITVDESQQIVLYNRAAEIIFGWPAGEVLGQHLNKLIPTRFHGAHGGHMHRFAATGVTSRRMGGHNLVHGQRRSGEEFPVEASISQLMTEEGRLYTVILRDVTERVRAQEELAAYAAQASAIREQEKARVARELHDELAQSLTALKMDTIWVRDNLCGESAQAQTRIAAMLTMLDGAVASTRRIAADLRPLVLDDLGLAAAIEWAVQNFTQRHQVACTLEMDEGMELREPYATAVFRIVQESLVNVAKHAAATQVVVRVTLEGDQVTLQVRDNGRGFDVGAPRKAASLGLAGLRERAHLLKGTLQIDSVPGTGTTVQATIPVGGADALEAT